MQRGKYIRSKETLIRMSESHKGIMKTPETRAKISAAGKGRVMSPETRAKISAAKNGKWSGHNYTTDGQTDAEAYFHSLMPHLEQEVCLGTGKAGREIWGTTWFKADFLDEEKKIVYEIDGDMHDKPERQDRDQRKDAFLESKGYKVIRYANDQVLSMGV